MNKFPTTSQDARIRKDIIRTRYRYGLYYGTAAGLSFALSNWGMDAFRLSQAHALQPWLKLIVAILICAPTGGLAGWLAARLDRAILSMLTWLVVGGVFAWLSVANTFQIYPALLGRFVPETLPYLKYSIYDILQTNGVMVYIWTGIFWSIIGLIQQPLLEQAVFSSFVFPKVLPLLVVLALVSIGGLFVDNLNNEPLRDPILALDKTIQFAIDTQDQEVDKATARQMHVAATRPLADWLDRSRYYFVSRFDKNLDTVYITVNFEGYWADCTLVFNQVSYCKSLQP
jgi:hypothetical protein